MRTVRSLLPGIALATASLFAAQTASAAIVSASAFPVGGSTYASPIGGGVTITWTIEPAGSVFQTKAGGGYTGIGISGQTAGEIDINEFLKGSTNGTGAFTVGSFTLGLLFDGPEFGDVQEVASVTARLADGTYRTGTLTNYFSTPTLWSVLGGTGTVTNLSTDATSSGGAVWQVSNPFGDAAITELSFTALAGVCASGLTCNNQSDFTFIALDARPVPEPATLGLLGVALVGVAFAARRRSAR